MRAFISHCSKQKEIAEEIRSEIGPDQCFVDKYDFNPAYKTMDEIVCALDNSGLFIFLISQESLKSDWCKKEVIKAYQFVKEQKIKLFLPYLIDNTVDIVSVKDEYPWIVSEDTYNLRYFKSSKMLARDIELKFRELERNTLPYSHLSEEIFIGRNDKIDDFQTKKARKRKAKALIVSGRPGIGRKRFCLQCAQQIKPRDRYFYETIQLGVKDGLPELLLWLNNLTTYYSEDRLTDILKYDEDTQIKALANIINETNKYNFRILVNDTQTIVDFHSEISPWFIKLTKSAELDNLLNLFIVSSHHTNHKYDDNEDIITVRLDAMSKIERQNLLIEYLTRMDADDYSDDDIEYFADILKQSPSQLIKIAEIIKESGVGTAKRTIGLLTSEGNIKIKNLLQSFSKNPKIMDFLAIISETSILSYEDVRALYGDEDKMILNIINQLINCGIISEFGLSSSYLRVDSAISDYITRTKIKPSKEFQSKFDSYLKSVTSKNISLIESPSLYILTTTKAMKDGRFDIHNLLLPSIALNYLIGLYNKGEEKYYIKAVDFCNQLLSNELNVILNEEVKQEIIFWKCLAVSHLQNKDAFYEAVHQITNPASTHFLKGFFKRKGEDYNGALYEFKQALKLKPGMNMARREKVRALIALKQYNEALEDAKKNFEYAKDNSYHVTAYFDCLLLKDKRTYADETKMHKLIDFMQNSMMVDCDAFAAGMKMKIKVRQPNIDRTEILKELTNLKYEYSNNKYIKDVVASCHRYLGLGM